MTPTASHQAGNSRREQLTSALVVGGVLVLLGAASGLGIEVTSSAAPLPKAPHSNPVTLPTLQPNTSGPAPVNYIGTSGPGNLPTIYPGGVVVATSGPSSSADSTRTTGGAAAPGTSASPTPAGSPNPPTLSCPSDVVTGLLDVLLGNNALMSGAGLLKTVLSALPNLASLLNGAGLSSVLTTTDVSHLSAVQTNSMAQACTPVLSGLLGSGS